MSLEPALPADVIHMLCDELSTRNDFSTLFSLLISSKQIAVSGAINALYRIAHECFGQANIDGTTTEDAPPAEARLITQKNSILWRTIVLSAAGKTSYPYCRHLRVLDLRDLGGLLQDDTFRSAQIYNHFFSGPLAQYKITSKSTRSSRLIDQLKIKDTVAAMGDVVVDQAPLLEALTEHAIETVFDTKLESWLPKLNHLRRLDVGDGRILANEHVRTLIHTHCSKLSELRLFSCHDSDADSYLAALIDGLPENTITLFENLSDCKIDKKTCEALTRHKKSLQTLSLALMDDSVLALPKLTGCSNLTTLAIDWLRPALGYATAHKDECNEVGVWLKTCTMLQDVTLKNIDFAPDLLTSLFQSEQVKLKTLTLTANEAALYDIRTSSGFHTLLAEQADLQELILAANADEASLQDRDVLLSTLCALSNLRKLRVTRLADDFVTSDLQKITEHLLNLEDLYIGGIGYDDDNLKGLSKLQKLKNIVIAGLSRFTAEGLVDFVLALGPGNQGISLQVDLADFDHQIQPTEEAFVAKQLAESVGGTFRYNLSRDPNQPNYSSSDSD